MFYRMASNAPPASDYGMSASPAFGRSSRLRLRPASLSEVRCPARWSARRAEGRAIEKPEEDRGGLEL